jgi:hypothetical protein
MYALIVEFDLGSWIPNENKVNFLILNPFDIFLKCWCQIFNNLDIKFGFCWKWRFVSKVILFQEAL